MMSLQSEVFDLGSSNVMMPIVPMFHANCWGLAFSAPPWAARS